MTRRKLFGLSLLSFFFLLLSISAQAQTGQVSGTVVDATSNEPLGNAVVQVESNATLVVMTDEKGNFLLKNVPTGEQQIVVSYTSYKSGTSTVFVVENETTVLPPISLVSDNVTRRTVKAKRNPASISSTIKETQEAPKIINVIGKEQISNSQDRDAAQAMQRVPGVTIIDNRFIMVRGLNQRYNVVLMNGLSAPSTEADSRAFSFDIIPSNVIDRMVVAKSGDPETPGDFAGAAIRVYTTNFVTRDTQSVSLTLGYRAGTTFTNFKTYKGSVTDALGFDAGPRQLPDGFPLYLLDIGSTNFAGFAEQARKFDNDWSMTQRTALPDIRFNYTLEKKIKSNKFQISNINNISYSNVWQKQQVTFNRYINYQEDGSSSYWFRFTDDVNTNNVRLGLMSNWSFRKNARNTYDFRNMYVRMGNKETTVRTGTDYQQNFENKNYSYYFQSRGFYSGQLQGTHLPANDKSKIVWVAGGYNTTRNEPDFRRARTLRTPGSDDPFQVVIPGGATTFDASRYFSELSETGFGHNLDYQRRLASHLDSSGVLLKAGYFADYRFRDFQARWMSYTMPPPSSIFDLGILGLPLEEIFADENIYYNGPGNTAGLSLKEGTNPTDKYSASNMLVAGYAGAEIPLRKFLVNTGVRTEYNHQRLDSENETGEVTVDNPIVSVMPFANVSFTATKEMVLRVAYSKTINRPEFREIAPFGFYDFSQNADIIGNPELKVCNIHNVDFRWELYPRSGETFSIGAFYKYFQNPIEFYLRQGSSNPTFQYDNAPSATVQGVELEIRKSFDKVFESKFLKRFAVLVNASLIRSSVDLGSVSSTSTGSRPLQGQSPYVINTGLYYKDDKAGVRASLMYNVYGSRIAFVGDEQIRTVYEMPRHLLDLTISKELSDRLEFRLGISDIMNAKFRLKEDGNFDNKLDNPDADRIYQQFRRGQNVLVGFNYKF